MEVASGGYLTMSEARAFNANYRLSGESVKFKSTNVMINSLRGACYDQHIECSQWAHDGECQKNPGYVLIHCPISCHVNYGIYFNLAFSALICHSPGKLKEQQRL